ncbi:hypothetical protein QVA66_05965 [Staphylococcus chromogenes]|nr:hypothetical protein [Staphylococcus chromogenes]
MRIKKYAAEVLVGTTVSLLIGVNCAYASEFEVYAVPSRAENVAENRSLEVNSRKTDELRLRTEAGKGFGLQKETPSGMQFEWVIETQGSEHSRTFEVLVEGEARLELDETSGAVIVYEGASPLAMIQAPWARDARGTRVPTRFEISGTKVTQVVEAGTADIQYPITADPRVDWGIVSGHVYFSKEETRVVAASAASAAAVSPFWVLVPPPFGEAIGYWWASNTSDVTVWATAALAQDKCLALKIGATGTVVPPSVGVSSEHYTDGCV